MKKGYLFVVLAVIIVIMFSLFNIFKKNNETQKPEASSIKVNLNEEFTLKEGDRAKIEGLSLYYKNTSFPPESYTGDREEFTYPQLEVEENGDVLIFPINKKLDSKIFHRYEISLSDMTINNTERSITLKIVPKEINSKITEEEAVKIALEEADKKDFKDGEAISRHLEWGLWVIEIASKVRTDIYMGVEIDANTGEVRRSYTDSRA